MRVGLMNSARNRVVLLSLACFGWMTAETLAAEAVAVDVSAYKTECGVTVVQDGQRILADWRFDKTDRGQLALSLDVNQPLIESISLGTEDERRPLAKNVEPQVFVT